MHRLWFLLIIGLLTAHPSHAQDVPGVNLLNGTTGLNNIPAAQPGPVDAGAFEIFAPFYAAVFGQLDGIVARDAGVIIGFAVELITPIATVGLILMAVIEFAGGGGGRYLPWLFGYIVRGSLVLTFIDTAGDYTRWVIDPISHMGDDISAALAGTLNQRPGHVFDVLMAHYSAASVQTITRLPWTSVLGALESLGLTLVIGLAWILAFVAVGGSFAVFLGVHLYLAAVLAIGPLFVLCAMAGQLRNWLMGWLNSVASLVISLILLGIGMTILTAAIDQILTKAANTADNINYWSSIGYLGGGMVLLFCGTVFAFLTRGIATGIVGGVYAAMQPALSSIQASFAAMMAASSAGGGAAAGGATAAQASPAPIAATAGPSLGGRIGP